MNNYNGFSRSKRLTYFAVLTALTVVLQLVGNTVRIGVVTLNFSLVPIVLCGILLGVWYGTALGAITGLIILLNCGILGADGFTNVLFATDPVLITLICILKTAAAGAVSGLIYKWLKGKNEYAATFAASASVPIINSLVFVLGCLLLIPSFNANGWIEEGKTAAEFIIIGLVGLNFVFELGVNLIVAPALYRVIRIIDRRFAPAEKENEPEDKGENG